jgi:Fe-S-cluster containining protein
LRGGYIASISLAAAAYVLKLGVEFSAALLVGLMIVTRTTIFLYFERHLAYLNFEEFKSGKLKHECIACGASCRLRVNLNKGDVSRILEYAKAVKIDEPIIESRGRNYWLRRRSGGACVFLKYENNKPRCSIYNIRPMACRLYPLIPSGMSLKVDPLCPGLSRFKGHTFKEHLTSQEVGAYVRKTLGSV